MNYLKIEGCENGYLLTLVEYVGDEFERDETQWVATSTAQMQEIFEGLIDDIRVEGVE